MWGWLVLMFLFSLNFMSAGGYILLVLMVAYTVIHLRDFSIRVTEVVLLIFAAEYFLFHFLWYRGATLGDLCNYLVAPWLLYWIGRHMAGRCRRADLPLRIAVVLILGFFTYGLLCMIYTMHFSPPAPGLRMMYKVWDQTPLSVTAGGLLLTMAMGLAMGQLTAKNSFRARLFWLAVLGACMYYAFTWAHRTSVYIAAILVVFNYLSFLLSMKISAVRKLGLLAVSVLAAAAIVLCFVFDVGGCYSWLQGQWLFQRLTDKAAANSTDRFVIWRSFFQQWLLYPLGGKQFEMPATYVHNFWLDVYYLCGALPFAALVTATVLIAGHFLRYRSVCMAEGASRSVHILANFYLTVLLAFMVEPVMGAYPYVVLAVLLVSGCVEGTVSALRQS